MLLHVLHSRQPVLRNTTSALGAFLFISPVTHWYCMMGLGICLSDSIACDGFEGVGMALYAMEPKATIT